MGASYRPVGTLMPFTNENTLLKAQQANAMDKFHAHYEAAVAEARRHLGRTYPLHIGGKELQGNGTFDDTNPANTTEVVGRFQKGTAEHVKQAVAAAKAAFPAWAATPWDERVRIFERAADIMAERKFELAAYMTLENGKNRTEAIYDVDEATDFLRYYAWQMREHKGYAITMGEPFPGEKCTSVMRPWGVFAVVGPFNFPLAIPTGMATGAMITGNTVVLKPASDTPLMSYLLHDILKAAGLPAGVFNLVTGGGRDVGQPLLEHPDVQGVVFTGSKEVGMKNYSMFVGHRPRPYIAEMGGKNAIVVTAKADLTKAVTGVVKSAFGFGGQKCSAASRCYVHESKYDEFVQRFTEEARKVKVAEPSGRDADMGPLINEGAVKTFEEAVQKAKAAGGRFLVGGTTLKEGAFAKGNYVTPTAVVDLPAGHEAFRNEYFVPFVAITKYRDFDAVITEVNAVEYGLTSGIFSEDPAEIQAYFDRVEAGVVYGNRARGGSTGAMVGGQSFGGWKFSATTSRGAGGPHYLEQFLREQSRTLVTGPWARTGSNSTSPWERPSQAPLFVIPSNDWQGNPCLFEAVRRLKNATNKTKRLRQVGGDGRLYDPPLCHPLASCRGPCGSPGCACLRAHDCHHVLGVPGLLLVGRLVRLRILLLQRHLPLRARRRERLRLLRRQHLPRDVCRGERPHDCGRQGGQRALGHRQLPLQLP